ncbi:MAG: kinesin, partial [Acidobacteria bacterium]
MSNHRNGPTAQFVALSAAAMVLVLFTVSPIYCQNSSDLSEANQLVKRVNELYDAGHYTEAIPLAETVLSIREKTFGADNIAVVTPLNNLAELLRLTRDYSRAEALHLRSLAIREKALGVDHPDVAASLHNLSLVYESIGQYAKAEPLCQRELAIREKVFGPDHPLV